METQKKISALVNSPSKNYSQRMGKGFSLAEIKESGKSVQSLNDMNIPIDYFRKSSHEFNIKTLKNLKIVEKRSKKKTPYVYKEKKRTPFKPTKLKATKKKVKKKTPAKKPTPKKRVSSIKKEKEMLKVEKKIPEQKGTPLTLLSGLGPTTESKFVELGVNSVEDLIKENPKELASLIKGVSDERLINWIEEGKKLI